MYIIFQILLFTLISGDYNNNNPNNTTEPSPAEPPTPSPTPSPNPAPLPGPSPAIEPPPAPIPLLPIGPPCNASNEELICGGAICRVVGNGSYCLCLSDMDCPVQFICYNNSKCLKKDLWPPSEWDISAGFVVLFATVLGVAAGRGGEGLLISVYMFLLHLSIRESIALSTVTLVGASLAYNGYYIIKKHPIANRPLIDYSLVCFIVPLMLSGSVFGAITMKVTPIWIFMLFLILLLIYTTYNLLVNGVVLWQQEARKKTFNNNKSKDKPETYGLMSHVDDYDEEGDRGNTTSLYYSNTIRTILKAEESVPYIYILSLLALWCYVIVTVILKGGDILPSPISLQCEQVPYWLYLFSILLLSILFTIAVGFLLKSNYDYKISIEYPILPSDINWTLVGVIILPLISLLAGFASGLFGISPSLVLEPLLQSNLHPDVVRAVSTNMGFFVISSSMVLYVIFGWVELEYGLLFGIIGFIGAIVHQVLVDLVILKKINRISIVQLSQAFLVGVGLIMLLIGIGFDVKLKSDQGKLLDHPTLCMNGLLHN